MKKLLASLLVLIMVPGGAFGLGLGKIERKSRIKEPFHATIEIIGAQREDLAGLTVRLADADRFRRAGLERPEVLSKLRFEVVRNERGSDYIKITSADPVPESFLNFLVEVNWPRGRLFREYTVLLEPPVFEPSVKKSLAGPARGIAAPRPGRPAPGARKRTGAQVPGVYGPTRRGDTLSEIAARTRASRSFSVNQMMLALLRSNPEAFFQQNINALKKGVVLRIPNAEEARSLSKTEALEQVKQHYAMWNDYRRGITQAVKKRPAGTAESRGTAPPEEKPVAPEPPSDDQLKLLAAKEAAETQTQAKEGGAEAEAEAQELADLRRELALANEELESKRNEVTTLKANLAEDDALIKDLKRQLEIKDTELAALQEKLTAQAQKEPVAEAPSPAVEPAPQPEQPAIMPPAAETPSPVPAPEVPLAGPPPQAEPAPEAPAETAPPALEVPPASEVAPPPAPEPEPVAPIAEAPQAPEPAPQTEIPEKGLLDNIPGGVVTLVAGAAVLLLALIAALTGKRAEKAALPTGEGFSFEEFERSEDRVPTVEPKAKGEISPYPESREFAEDPLADVNVHLAYKQFDEAESLVKRAIEVNPNEPNYRLRLLEVYQAAGNKRAFEDHAKVLFAVVGGAGALWDKAVAMWREMSPERALFEEAEAPQSDDVDQSTEQFIDLTGGVGSVEPVSEAQFVDITGDLTKPEANVEKVDFFAPEPEMEAPQVETGITGVESKHPVVNEEGEPVDVTFTEGISHLQEGDFLHRGRGELDTAELGEVEFDLTEMTFEPVQMEEEGPERPAKEDTILNDLSWLKDERVPPISAAQTSEVVGPAFGVDKDKVDDLDHIHAFDFYSEPENTISTISKSKGMAEEPTVDIDVFGTEPASLFHSAESDTDSDEIDTKLNLAITYIELGDTEGARSILNEVALSGSAEQQSEAKELLRQIAS